MSRTAIIYHPDPDGDTLAAVFLSTDRPTETRIYEDPRDLSSDIMEHIRSHAPCLCHGREYNGDLSGLVLTVSNESGHINLKYPFYSTDSTKITSELFREFRLSDFRERSSA